MKILLCNERFLFRFGVDRVLILLGHGLKDLGHRIIVMANKFDRPIVEEFCEKIISVPDGGGSYLNLNEFTAQWLENNWDMLFDDESRPDVAVIGGWPFLLAVPFFRKMGIAVVFSDHGVVPMVAYSGEHRAVLEKLVKLRQSNLNEADAIVGVSRFITKTQSCVDAPKSTDISAILNGADHMSLSLWNGTKLGGGTQDDSLSNKNVVSKLKANGNKTILNLGRWEPGCYKNSDAIFKLIDDVTPHHLQVSVLILADPKLTEIPARYRDSVIPIGFPDDAELQTIMSQVDLGVTVSLWEGFNLPLAEMQWLDKPVLAFNIGAHPEVILHPWFLCRDLTEMGLKATALLSGRGPEPGTLDHASERFHANFKWRNVVDQYEGLFERIVNKQRSIPITILVDVTNASRDPANSGVIRVSRRLSRELQRFCRPLYVVWGGKEQGYVFPTRSEYQQLSQFNGPHIDAQAPFSPDDARLLLIDAGVLNSSTPTWLLFTETIHETNGHLIRAYAKQAGIRIGAIFYDAIPIIRPDLVKDTIIRENHSYYMKGLAHCDLVIPISQFSAQSLKTFWATEGLMECAVKPNLLPGEFGGASRILDADRTLPRKIDLLCVSTLEPRKNHRKLIGAVNLFARQHPEVDWSLTLIGNRYAGGDDIAEFVDNACSDNSRIHWLGIVDDIRLHQAYAESTFTIYASEIEGFGMPILESIWHGKPCLCHEQGVMSELAAGGGCVMVDVTCVEKMAAAIGELATNKSLYSKLVQEAITRPIKTWEDYAHQFWSELIAHSVLQDVAASTNITERQFMDKGATPLASTWVDILYRGCLTQEWQMNDSERLGLAAVLQRLNPSCAIEIGTFRGGSLSLISQYAEKVFSIDIDPSIPEKFKHFANVSFFTGPSQVIMPTLLQALDDAEMPVEFVLIDGDHSAAGVKRDIDIMLDYVPKKPLIIMMHDGFNPECRRGMLEADWNKSPYVQYVDLDFIPGRVIEHGGGGDGEMWGGLAMAYFSPTKRVGKIDVGATARRTYAEMKERHYG